MPENLFKTIQKQQILRAIREAEKDTSGEIRVHIEDYTKGDVLDRAADIFEKLKMHKTRLRNGVLFYLAFRSRKFAILGDAGINMVVPENFWDDIKTSMEDFFTKEEFTEGLVTGISMAGKILKNHFPYQKDDINELPDEISLGKNSL